MKTVVFTDPQLQTHYRSCHLIEIQAGIGSATYYRYTDWPSNVGPVTIDGVSRTFTARPLHISSVVQATDDQQDSEVVMGDQDHLIKSLALLYDFREWPITIWEYRWSLDGSAQGSHMLISGFVDGVEFIEEGLLSRAVFGVLSSSLAEQGTGPRQEYSRGCRFRYKDAQCAATSALTTCPRTVPACTDRLNIARYGGFPFCPRPGARFAWGGQNEIVLARMHWTYGEVH